MMPTILSWFDRPKKVVFHSIRTSIPSPSLPIISGAERGGVNFKLNHTTSNRRSYTYICAKPTAYKLKSVISIRSQDPSQFCRWSTKLGDLLLAPLSLSPRNPRMFAPMQARRFKASVFSRHVSTADSVAPSIFLHGFSCSSIVPPYHVYRTQDFQIPSRVQEIRACLASRTRRGSSSG